MSKELEALENIYYHLDGWNGNLYKNDYEIVKTALKEKENQDKILRIIKEKQLDVGFLVDCEWDLDTYNKHFMTYKNHSPYRLTQAEFELLKGWLEDGV